MLHIAYYCSVVGCLQAVDEQIAKLQPEQLTDDTQILNAHLQRKTILDRDRNIKIQQNCEQRAVSP